jgi:hypothetical protein
MAMEGLEGLGGFAMANPVGLGVTAAAAGGLYLWNRHQKQQEQQRQETSDLMGSSITSGSDYYAKALGVATNATVTLADTMYSASKKIAAGASSTTSYAQSNTVTPDDIKNARGAKGPAYLREGGVQGGIAQVRALRGPLDVKASPQQNQLIKEDLLKSGFSPKDVEAILAGAGTSNAPLSTKEISQVVSTVGTRAANKGGLGSGSKHALNRVLGNIDQQYKINADKYGAEYASAVRAQQINEIMGPGASANAGAPGGFGQSLALGYLGKQFQSNVGKDSGLKFNTTGGGPFIANAPTPGAKVLQPGNLFTGLAGGGGPLAALFNQTSRGNVAGAFGSDLSTESASSQERAIRALLAGARRSQGKGGAADLGTRLYQLAAAQDQDTASGQVSMMAAQRAMTAQVQRARTAGQGRGTSLVQNLNVAATPIFGDSTAARQQQLQAAQSAQGQVDEFRSMMQQRLQAQIQYQQASARSAEDFRTSQARSEQDFNKTRSREYRDFNKNLRRQAEDGAKSMYDAYHRIAVEPLWDAKSLNVNRRDQNTAMRQQLANLRKARAMGISNATIQQLDLTNPAHAQELQELVSGSTAGDVRQMNVLTNQRIKLAGALNQDPGNTQAVRARQDFQQSLKDQTADFKTANERMAQDFRKSQGRMAEDLHRSQLSMVQDWTTLYNALQRVQKGQSVNAKSLMANDMKTWQSTLSSAGVNISNLQKTVTDMQIDPRTGTIVLFNPGTSQKWTIPHTAGYDKRAAAWYKTHPDSGPYKGAAAGYLATSKTNMTVGEAGAEAIVPLTASGMHIIRAIERFIDPGEYKQGRTAAARTYVNVTSHNTYDHSVNIEKVESHADARSFMKEMAEMSRRANLTATGTRKAS